MKKALFTLLILTNISMKLFSQEKKLISLIINQNSLNNGFAGEKIMLVKKIMNMFL